LFALSIFSDIRRDFKRILENEKIYHTYRVGKTMPFLPRAEGALSIFKKSRDMARGFFFKTCAECATEGSACSARVQAARTALPQKMLAIF
jgi:hypothetical protein